jgi:hypothetical protein
MTLTDFAVSSSRVSTWRFGDFELIGRAPDPHQLPGIEISPRAAAIADLVLRAWSSTMAFPDLDNCSSPSREHAGRSRHQAIYIINSSILQ